MGLMDISEQLVVLKIALGDSQTKLSEEGSQAFSNTFMSLVLGEMESLPEQDSVELPHVSEDLLLVGISSPLVGGISLLPSVLQSHVVSPFWDDGGQDHIFESFRRLFRRCIII